MQIGSYSSTGSVFNPPGARPQVDTQNRPVQPVEPVEGERRPVQGAEEDRPRQAQAQAASADTATTATPSEDDRRRALDSGRTRGAFLDVSV